MLTGLILGIESSCDETAASVVERGSRTLSSVVASQIATHARYGGVVPELASREHLRAIVPVVRAALAQANITLADLDAIAVTAGPGLVGALLVGVTYAKALAFAQGLPLIAINHLEGHIHAVLLHESESGSSESQGAPSFPRPFAERMGDLVQGYGLQPVHKLPGINRALAPEGKQHRNLLENPGFSAACSAPAGQVSQEDEPALALVVSGGHTHLYLARPFQGVWTYSLVGRTLDDAAGEAYDKVAKLLGFGYPGGPWIDALACFGDPLAVPFAFSQIKTKLHLAGKPPRTKAAKTAPIADLDPRFLFSFSGIKTAVLRYVELHNLREEAQARAARLFASSTACAPDCNLTAVGRDFSLGTKPNDPAGLLMTAGKLDLDEGYGLQPVHKLPGISRVLAPEANPRPPKTKAEALALCPQETLDLVASFQHAVVGDLMKKTFAAAESLGARRILITGGVAANRELRARFAAEGAARGVRIAFPTLALSTDNAAMIAAAAWPRFLSGEFADQSLSANPSLALGNKN